MIVIYIAITAAYMLIVVLGARKIVGTYHRRKEIELGRLTDIVDKKAQKKEHLTKEKLKMQSEATNIFTLYEITKDITKTLSETAAFEMFKKKLAEHVKFLDCQFLRQDEADIQKQQKDEDFFLFSIKSKNKKVGYLSVKGVSDAEKEIVAILATQFSLALRRVELYQEIERTAITDSLTELYTRRYTMERLTEEINRSKAQHLKLALLMIDVDHFKKFNDSYGHLTGDQVLRETGNVIRANLREIDIAGRYGGEEFCVVLPDTDLPGAKFAAERIRQATDTTQFKAYE